MEHDLLAAGYAPGSPDMVLNEPSQAQLDALLILVGDDIGAEMRTLADEAVAHGSEAVG